MKLIGNGELTGETRGNINTIQVLGNNMTNLEASLTKSRQIRAQLGKKNKVQSQNFASLSFFFFSYIPNKNMSKIY